MNKYTAVSIPRTLQERIGRLIWWNPGFKSVSDYVIYVLREMVEMHKTEHTPDPFTSEDVARIKERLNVLGYL